MSENKYLLQIMQKRYDKNRENKEINEKDKEIERLNNIIETYKDANEYHQNKIEELEKALRKSHSQIYSENVMLRVDNNKLNNIINELEKELLRKLEAVKYLKDTLGDNVYVLNPHIDLLETEYNYFSNKLKELKESSNNEG